MQLRGCIIGDSHVAALKQAWDQLSTRYEGVDLDIFGSIRQTLNLLELDGSHLVSRDKEVKSFLLKTGGSEYIDLDKYDFIFTAGLVVSTFQAVHLAGEHPTFSMKRASGMLTILSEAAFIETVKDRIKAALGYKIYEMCKIASNARVGMIVTPAPCEDMFKLPTGQESVHKSYRAIVEARDEKVVKTLFDQAVAELSSDGVTIITQPQETFSSEITTKRKYMSNSSPLGNLENFRNDNVHANSDYGSLILTNLFQKLKSDGAITGTLEG
jgi:hypothetical protein